VRVLRHRTTRPVTGRAYGYALSDETARPDVTATSARRGKTVLWTFSRQTAMSGGTSPAVTAEHAVGAPAPLHYP